MQRTRQIPLAKSQQNHRRTDRIGVVAKARCRTSSWVVSDAVLQNISEDGCCIVTRQALEVGQEVTLRANPKQISGIVRWCRDKRFGIEFAEKLGSTELAELISSAASISSPT